MMHGYDNKNPNNIDNTTMSCFLMLYVQLQNYIQGLMFVLYFI